MVRNSVYDMFDDLFEATFSSFNYDGIGSSAINRIPLNYITNYSAPHFPPVDVEIDEITKDLFFTFALAGYNSDEIRLNFEGDYLELAAEIITKEKDKKYSLKKGIKKTSFSYKYTVPMAKYDSERVEATFEDGLLKIKVPAREGMKPKQVKIEFSKPKQKSIE